MEVGFTGTREGMTLAQKEAVAELLDRLDANTVHHGDCVGADADFHLIAISRGSEVVIHPPKKEDLRAYCGGKGVTVHPPKSYLARNRDIVDDSEALIVTPKEDSVQPKGGTWYTFGYANTTKKPFFLVWPDGSVWDSEAESRA